jgi:RNA polymerase sigma factor (sigma-70 family)
VDILTATKLSDPDLVTACLQRDQHAWNELLKRYKRLIYAVTLRFGFDKEDRHDIFQAVCLETIKSLSSLRTASSLRYWILTITIRQCYSMLKRKREEQSNQTDEAAISVHDGRMNTMEIYLAAERAEIVHEALDELPERCRSLLECLFFSEAKTPYSDLGGLLGLSKDSVGSTRLRCLSKLRKILEARGF